MRLLLMAASVLCLVGCVLGQDSLNMWCVSRYELWDGLIDVAVEGTFAYVTTGSTGLQVLDISDPAAPQPFASQRLAGHAQRVLVDGDYAYITDPDSGLRIVDIADPLLPEVGHLLTFDTEGGTWGLVKTGNLVAFFYAWPHRLAVINVANPQAPTLYCDIELDHFTGGGLAARDSLIFYTDYSRQSLCILDVHNPAAPVELVSLPGVGFSGAKSIALQGDYAYLATSYNGLLVVNIANPAAPAIVAQLELSDLPDHSAVTSDYLLVSASGGLRIFDLSNPALPNPVGSWPGVADCPTLHMAMAVNGTLACVLVPWRCQAFVTLDLTDPAVPQVLGMYDRSPAYQVTGVAPYGDYLALSFEWNGTGTGGLLMMNAANPAVLEVASWRGTMPAYDVAVRDNVAYTVSAYFDRLDDPGEFVTYDLTDPANPAASPWLEIPVAPMEITFGRHYAFVGCADQYASGLAVVDVENPAQPVLVNYRDWNYQNPRLAATDSLLLVADYAGLFIYRTDQPDSVVLVGSTLTEEGTGSVAIHGHYAYLGSDSLYVVDFANPAAPVVVAAVAGPYGHEMVVDGDRLYGACHQDGVAVWDISNPLAPQEIAYYDTPGEAYDVAVRDSFVFVADDRNIGVYRLGLPVAVEPRDAAAVPRALALSAFPNPFNATTTLRFDLPVAGDVNVRVYDITGRQAAELVRDHLAAGSYTARFDGSKLGSGIYFIALQTADQQRTTKVVLLK